ncbi:GNAT family N-acetyltransferase [Extibacter muris]|uniref:GNAT family N-acetyltransferase n=1 Tax=Extibacter muris TaxID=1796622 RepID=A0A4R4FE11_9FIRM|nr:GNAT family N-acetyltransferase [Extibacter muris]MCU0079175.1 GNAT family N-acetyltransferase [Extibacter muris]TDA20973.1 GNAT family N-acetyltransferase [Extibacter muris]
MEKSNGLNISDKDKYIKFCSEEEVCVFLNPFWMDAVCGEENWDVIVVEKDNRVAGCLVYAFIQYGNKIRVIQPKFTQSNGVWISYPQNQKYEKKLSYEKEIMKLLIERLESKELISYQQYFNVNITNWLPFYWKGYRQTTCYSYRIMDISDVDTVFESFASSKKRNIRHALKLGVKVGYDMPAKDFYKLHEDSLLKSDKKISYTFSLFERIYNAAYANDSGRIIYAVDSDDVIKAAMFCIWDTDCAFDLIFTIQPEFRNSGALTLLIYEMIKKLSGHVKSFDMEGSMIESVEDSYSKLGTKQLPYFNIQKEFVSPVKLLFYKVLNRLNKCE